MYKRYDLDRPHCGDATISNVITFHCAHLGANFEITSEMAEGQTQEQIRCWLCSVSSDTQRQYLQHFTTKPYAEMEDIQKRTDAIELEVHVEFEMSVHVPPQAKVTQASLVPG